MCGANCCRQKRDVDFHASIIITLAFQTLPATLMCLGRSVEGISFTPLCHPVKLSPKSMIAQPESQERVVNHMMHSVQQRRTACL